MPAACALSPSGPAPHQALGAAQVSAWPLGVISRLVLLRVPEW